jgi:hypothetical protein
MTQTVGHASSNYPYFTSRVDIVDSDHYQSPKEIDGDYSYAYSDCISPAFIIRSEGDPAFNENIYEEINVEDKTEDEENTDKTNEFSRSPQFSLKSLSSSQKSVSLERKGENSNSVKGEGYKRIISEELNGGSDGYGRLISEELNGGPECTPMFEDLEEVNRKMSHLHMDVKDLLHPLTYSSNSNHSRGTADSGFESGELSSINSSSFSTSKSSVVSRTNSSEVLKSHKPSTSSPSSEVLKRHRYKEPSSSSSGEKLDPSLVNKSVRVSLVDMSHTIDHLDHIVGILKGDIL